MKHKLTVLAVLSMALLLSTNFAIAQNVVDIPGGTLERCATAHVPVMLMNMGSDIGAIGIPLVVVGDAEITSATPVDLAAFGFTTSTAGFPGTAGVLNAFHPAGCGFPPAGIWMLWDLEVTTGNDCSGTVEIDMAFYPPAGAFIILDCMGAPDPQPIFQKGVFTITNTGPTCATNPDHTINFLGSISQQLTATAGNSCATLEYGLVDGGGLTDPDITTEGLFTYDGACADIGVHTVEFSVTDDCGNAITCTFQVTVENNAPECGTNDNETTHFATDITGKQLNATDPDGNPLTFTLGTVVPPFNTGTPEVTAEGVFSLTGAACDDLGTHTVTFNVSDGCYDVDCTFDVTITQDAPVCTQPTDETLNWRQLLDKPLVAADDGCQDPLQWSIVSQTPMPAIPATIIGLNTFHFDAECADVGGSFTMVVEVTDGLETDQCQFVIDVINPDPVITCPGDIADVILGELVTAQPTATDQYGDPLNWSIVSMTHDTDPLREPHEDPAIAPGTGAFSWQTSNLDPNDEGTWEVCIMVQDGCGGMDFCCFTIEVEAAPFQLCLGPAGPLGDTAVHVLNGQIATMYVKMMYGYHLGGFDLLICYDPSALSFLSAEAEGNVEDWEYFSYRHSYDDNCGGGCPSGYIRVLAIADLDNGPDQHPDPLDFQLEGEIVALKFYVTPDRNFIGQCIPVSFCSFDCGDNVLSSKDGNTVYIISGEVAPDVSCLEGKIDALVFVDPCGGRICIDEPPDDRGDINMNGLANEVGDAVLFTNYFIHGDIVWDETWMEAQILATDVNDDGIVLTVADLVYLIRIMTGDADPFPANPKLSPYASAGNVSYRADDGALSVSANSSVDVGGAYFVFRYSGMAIGTPSLSDAASDMRIRSSAANGELRVLVTPSYDMIARVPAGNNELFTVPTDGDGRIELVESQLSDANGALMSTTSAAAYVPTKYSLHQNYPNPFNAGTVIPFDLRQAGDWTLDIYNVAGQLVKTFTGYSTPGQVSVSWNGVDNGGSQTASGVYFYRVTSGDFTATKKMTLLK